MPEEPVTEPVNLITPELWQHIVRHVEALGRDRVRTQQTMSDADFLAGALAAMNAMGMPLIKAPASWTFGLMFGGTSPLRD